MEDNIVQTFLTLQTQIRILHWNTTSFAEHKAFGSFYSTLDDLVDKFVEAYIGGTDRNTVIPDTININISRSSTYAVPILDDFIEFLKTEIQKQCESYTDLLNIRDEMLGETYRLKYLLTLTD